MRFCASTIRHVRQPISSPTSMENNVNVTTAVCESSWMRKAPMLFGDQVLPFIPFTGSQVSVNSCEAYLPIMFACRRISSARAVFQTEHRMKCRRQQQDAQFPSTRSSLEARGGMRLSVMREGRHTVLHRHMHS